MSAPLPVAKVVEMLPGGYIRIRCPHGKHVHLLRAAPGLSSRACRAAMYPIDSASGAES
jgi:hypothetical protein